MANICSNTKVTGIIYRYESPSGKYYIGQTIDEKRRKATHKNLASKGIDLPFYRAIRKYGFENFEYVVLFTIQSRSKERVKVVLNALEKYYISRYKRGGKLLYNVTDGGDGIIGDKVTDKITAYWNGKSEQEMKDWSDKISFSKSKPVLQFNLDGTFVKEYTNIYRSEIKNPQEVMRCARGEIYTSGGYIWKYKKDCENLLTRRGNLKKQSINLGKSGPPKKPILQYSKDGEFIREWTSASDVQFIKRKAIVECLSGRNKTAGGFIWKYKE